MADPCETSVPVQVQVESWPLTHHWPGQASWPPLTQEVETHSPVVAGPGKDALQKAPSEVQQKPRSDTRPPTTTLNCRSSTCKVLRSHPKVQVIELELVNVQASPSPLPPILMILVEKNEQSTASRKLTFFPSVLSGLWEKVNLQKVNHEIKTTGSPAGVCWAASGHLALFKGTCPFLRPPGQSHWHHHLASMKSRNGFKSVRPASEENRGWL